MRSTISSERACFLLPDADSLQLALDFHCRGARQGPVSGTAGPGEIALSGRPSSEPAGRLRRAIHAVTECPGICGQSGPTMWFAVSDTLRSLT